VDYYIARSNYKLNHQAPKFLEADHSISIFIDVLYYVLPVRLRSFGSGNGFQDLVKFAGGDKTRIVNIKHIEGLR